MRKLFFLLFIMALFTLEACLNIESPCTTVVSSNFLNLVDTAKLNRDGKIIDAYLAKDGINAIKDPTGLRYVISQNGDGETPCLESTIFVSYTGKLLSNNLVFDSTSTAVPLQLNSLILGWQIGFLKLSKGAEAVFYIPSELAYGSTDRNKIPANSILIFEVEFEDLLK